MRIVILHPSDRISRQFKAALEQDGHSVMIAHSPDEAYQWIRNDLSGIELALIDENEGAGTFVYGLARQGGIKTDFIFIVSNGKMVTPVKGARYFPYCGGDCESIIEFVDELYGG